MYTDNIFVNCPFEKKLANKGIPIPITIETIPLSELIDNMKKYVDEMKK